MLWRACSTFVRALNSGTGLTRYHSAILAGGFVDGIGGSIRCMSSTGELRLMLQATTNAARASGNKKEWSAPFEHEYSKRTVPT